MPYPIQTPFPPTVARRSARADAVWRRAFRDFEFFVRYFFPDFFWGGLSPVHMSFCEREDDPARRFRREVCAAPRGNAKTVFRTLAKTIHGIVYRYEPFQVVVGYSDDEAKGKLADIIDQLNTNTALRAVYGPTIAPKGGTKAFRTGNGCKVVARGRGGQIRGLRYGRYRPTRIVLDDVEALEESRTPEQRAKTKEWFQKDVVPSVESNPASGGNFDFIGTVIHEDSLLANLLEDPTWRRWRFKSILREADEQALWAEWRRLVVDLTNTENLAAARAFYEARESDMLAGVEVLWPDGEPYYNLQLMRVSMGAAAFGSEKQNEPYDPESQILHPDICPRFRVYWPGDPEWDVERFPWLSEERFVIVRADDERVVKSTDLRLVAYLDPAMGKHDEGDYNALVIVGQDPDLYAYVLDAWIEKKPPRVTIAECYGHCEAWGVDKLHLEAVGAFALMGELFKDSAGLYDWGLKVIPVHQHTDKQGRIMRLEPWVENRWLLLNEDISATLITQMRQFPTGHDDGPDALEGAVRKLVKPQGRIVIPVSTGLI